MLGVGGLQPSVPPSWNRFSHHRQTLGPQPLPPRMLIFLPLCALSKQGHRFLSSLATTSTADDPSATNRLIRKIVASSSKSVSLSILHHLLSPNTTHPRFSLLALPLYLTISEAPWFNWNPKLAADVVALLYKQERLSEAEALISETVSKLGSRERQLCMFFCNLIDSHSKHNSKRGLFDSYSRLKQLLSHSSSSSVYLRRRGYESMVNALCVMGLPRDAEKLMEEMRGLGLKPSVFEIRSLVYAYGKLGLFEDMERSVLQMESDGFELDTVCSNMVLSSFGAYSELMEMVSWLRRMKSSDVPFLIRTYNSVLNWCPTITSLLQDPKNVPLSIEELMGNLCSDEALLVQELIGSSPSPVLVDAMEWNSSEVKLDLHGLHLGSAYLIVLQWLDEMRRRFVTGNHVIPVEVMVVCGSGKHSTVRRESPVKRLVKDMIVQMKCPMRIDRKNIGCFVAKGKVFKDWLR